MATIRDSHFSHHPGEVILTLVPIITSNNLLPRPLPGH